MQSKSKAVKMKLANQLSKLGTETAFLVSASAAEWTAKGHKVYPFHLGDINIPTPANIVEAANRAIRDGRTGYCAGAGIKELREALAEDVNSKWHTTYTANNVSVQPGGKPVIGKFLSSIMNPGDEVLYPNPGYPIYESQIEYLGGMAVPYGYIETDSGFVLDMAKIEGSITDKTRVLIYNNYQNPTGAQSSRQEMEALAELAIRHDLIVLTDDAYFEIQYEDAPMSILDVPGMVERTVILYTFSKRFAMTGWRVGAAIGPKEVIDVINKLNANAESCTTHFIQWAAIEALQGDQSGSKAILETLKQRRDAAVVGLNAIDGISVSAPKSTFYLFPNVTGIMNRKGMTDVTQLMDGALTNADVSFCTRKHFGRPTPDEKESFIRIAYSGISVDDINIGMQKLKIYLEA